MRTFILIYILVFGFMPLLLAQARVTDPIRQRIQGKTDFDEIKSGILNYFSVERAKLSPNEYGGFGYLTLTD